MSTARAPITPWIGSTKRVRACAYHREQRRCDCIFVPVRFLLYGTSCIRHLAQRVQNQNMHGKRCRNDTATRSCTTSPTSTACFVFICSYWCWCHPQTTTHRRPADGCRDGWPRKIYLVNAIVLLSLVESIQGGHRPFAVPTQANHTSVYHSFLPGAEK